MISPSFKIKFKLFLLLALGFVAFTIIGTLSHELGHCAVAKYLGYSPKLSYGYMVWLDDEHTDLRDSVYRLYYKELQAGQDFPCRKRYEATRKQQSHDNYWILWGGPAQTMLTGTIGFAIVVSQRRKFREAVRLSFTQWLLVFLSLFWLRQSANFVTWIAGYIITGQLSGRSDETNLALYLHLPKWSIELPTAMIGFALLAFIIFYIIPMKVRAPFLLAGLIGGIFGYFFWLSWVGPLLMP